MKISIGVTASINKTQSEDTAFFNSALFYSGTFNDEADPLVRLGIADGVGGNSGGANASRYISSEIIHTNFSDMSQADIEHFVSNLNIKLIEYAKKIPGEETMATTLTSIVQAADGYYLIHAGNTRLYVLQGSYLKQVTHDQTTYQWLLNLGQRDVAERCNRYEINCCLGGGNSQYAKNILVEKVFAGSFPNTIFMTSDGIHEFVDLDTMEALIKECTSDRILIEQLMELATKNGSTDDKTVIIVRMDYNGTAI